MGNRGPAPVNGYNHVMRLLRRGEFASLGEAAGLVGVSAQRIGQWCKAVGLDWRAIRNAKVQAIWSRELKRLSMKSRGKQPVRQSKAATRDKLNDHVAAFVRKGGTIKRC